MQPQHHAGGGHHKSQRRQTQVQRPALARSALKGVKGALVNELSAEGLVKIIEVSPAAPGPLFSLIRHG